jgi:hypothetical protein
LGLHRILWHNVAATSIFGLPCSYYAPTRTPQMLCNSGLKFGCKSRPPCLALCELMSKLCRTLPQDTPLPHAEIGIRLSWI